jgi:hypothetical protein
LVSPQYHQSALRRAEFTTANRKPGHNIFAMRVQILLKAENLPAPKVRFGKKIPNAFAIVSNVSDVGSVMGIKRHRVGVTEV